MNKDIKQKAREMFDEKFDICNNPDHGFIDALSFHDIGRLGCPGCGGKFDNPKLFTPSELKNFIDQIIDLATAERDKNIESKLDEVWGILCEMDTNIKSEKEYAKEIINLINSKK